MSTTTITHAQKLAGERADLLAKGSAVTDRCKAEGRAATPDEANTVKAAIRRVEEIDAWTAEARAADDLMSQMASFGAPAGSGDRERFGAAGFDAEAVKFGLQDALRRKGSYGFNMPFVKGVVTAGGVDLPGSGTLVSGQPIGTGVVALRDLLQPMKAESGNVRFYTVGAGTATVVAEGGKKLDMGITVTPVDAALQKVAGVFSYTDELAEDASWLIQYVAAEATRAILVKENALIVAALVAASTSPTGTGTVANALDVLAAAIGAAQATNGVTPTAILASPTDVATIRTAKAATSGEYHIDPLSSAPTGIHGVNLVPTPAVAQGEMFLLSPGLGAFYSRGSLRVESGFTADDWQYNLVSTRVEERVLPAIIRPSLLTRITLT